ARAYRAEALLHSSRYGLLEAMGAVHLDKGRPDRGWTLWGVHSRAVPGLGGFSLSLPADFVWKHVGTRPRLTVTTGLSDARGGMEAVLRGAATLAPRPELLARPRWNRRVELRVERQEMPPSDLRRP